MGPLRLGVVSILVAALGGAPAAAVDQLVAGRRLVLRHDAGGDRLVVVVRDALVLPTPGATDAPTLVGAQLHIGNPDTAEWVHLTLAADGWWPPSPSIYRFLNPAVSGVGSEVQTVVLRAGKGMRVRGSGIGITLDEPAQGAIAVVLTSGTRRWCAIFGGRVKRDVPGRFTARRASAPDACPEPYGTSTTTTRRPTTTQPAASTTSTSSTSSTAAPGSTTSTTSTTATSAPSTTSTSTTSTTSTSTTSTASTSSTSTSTSSTSTSTTSTTTTTLAPTTTSSSSTTSTSDTSTSSSTTDTSTTTSTTDTSTSSSTTETSTTTSTSETSTTVAFTCGGVFPFCGGTCEPGKTCGGLFCTCE